MRSDLPTGTVTFVFTDVEGSTRLLRELGAEEYAAALLEHRRVLRDVFGENGGVEVDTEGDAFFFAFPTASGALAGAAAAQERLVSGRLRVRMGVHTGTPLLTAEGYVGEDVHRAARIAAAAHGGQVLLSAATAGLGDTSEYVDLGEHRFKDLLARERIFQLGSGSFPAIRSLYRTNLPVPATPFLGRERELGDVVRLLAGLETRLVTLTGPGGTGKTRLALQAAAELADSYPDGVFWVPLAPVRDASLVASTIASALDISEDPGQDRLESLTAALVGKRLLLVLDNAEHLMANVAEAASTLISRTADVDVVVTSRERLRIAGEAAYAVPTLATAEAVRLFLARARATDPSFAYTPAVDELCRRLDDLPLALELAAARVGLLSVEQLLERLGQRLDLLKGARDVDVRQQTLRATVAWSYDLLDEEERDAYCRFSVFAGGCALESAEDVCESDIDTLQSLLDKSLLRRREGRHGPRLWMLETLREFAAEQLAAGDGTAAAMQRHLRHYALLAERVAEIADTGGEYDFDLVEDDFDNFRVAMAEALATDPARALALAANLGDYWSAHAHVDEGRQRLTAALAAAPDAAARDRVRGLRSLGLLALTMGELEAARSASEEALELARRLGDRRQPGFLLNNLAIEAWYRGALDDAKQLLLEAREAHRKSGNARGDLMASVNLGGIANSEGDYAHAVELLTQAAVGFRGRDGRGLAKVLNNLGLAQEALGRTEEARLSLEESIALSREYGLGDTLGYADASLAHLLLDSDADAAAERYRESLRVMQQTHDLRGVAYCLEGLAAAAVRLDDHARAAYLLGAAAAVRAVTGASLSPIEQDEVDQTARRARVVLGEKQFAVNWNRGNGISADEAAEYAVVDPKQ